MFLCREIFNSFTYRLFDVEMEIPWMVITLALNVNFHWNEQTLDQLLKFLVVFNPNFTIFNIGEKTIFSKQNKMKTSRSNHRIFEIPCLTSTKNNYSPSSHGIHEIITFKHQSFFSRCFLQWISSLQRLWKSHGIPFMEGFLCTISKSSWAYMAQI